VFEATAGGGGACHTGAGGGAGRCGPPAPGGEKYPSITLSPHNFQAGFHIRRAKRIMASLDDLEVQRVKPFERLCFVMYVVLHMIFVFMALSFVKLLTETR
jgi:hypothetical protein